jgi:hypothetical protein
LCQLLDLRILDNLPLVVPIKRMDKDAPTVYQHGVHVGIKGQYSGVSSELQMLCIFACAYVNFIWVHILVAEQGGEAFHPQPLDVPGEVPQGCRDGFC